MLAFLLIGAAKILLFLGSIAQMVSRAPTAVIESCFWRLSSALRRLSKWRDRPGVTGPDFPDRASWTGGRPSRSKETF